MSEFEQLKTRLTLENTQFKTKLAESTQAVQKFSAESQAITARGATLFGGALLGGVTLLAAGLGHAINKFDELTDSANNLGVGVERLQELNAAADQLGSSAENVSTLLAKMEKTIGAAGEGSKGAVDALAKIGLTFKDLEGLAPDEQLKKIGKALAALGDQDSKISAGNGIFGRGTAKSLTFLTADLDKATQKAREMGEVLSEEGSKKVGDLADKFAALGNQITTTFGKLLAASSPAINFLIDGFSRLLSVIGGVDGAVFGFARDALNIGGYDPNADGKPRQKPNTYTPTDYSNFDFGGARAQQNTADQFSAAMGYGGEGDDGKKFDSILKNLQTRDQILTTSFEGLSSATDRAKSAVEGFAQQMSAIEDLRNNRYDDYKGKPQLQSQEFDDIARELLDKKLAGTLTNDEAKSQFDSLRDITDTNFKSNDAGTFDEFSTASLKNDLKNLQKLIFDDKTKVDVEVTVNASPEFDASISKKLINGIPSFFRNEAVATNR